MGFRPFVYRLACELGVAGWVRNDSSAAVIEGEASADLLDRFWQNVQRQLPPLAQIDEVVCQPIPPQGEKTFAIRPSLTDDSHRPIVAIDTAVCPDCVRELFDPADLRYQYPLINCTNCGPRYTIIRAMPYDRPNTTMAGFALCDNCRQQYTNPADRRFHAQPVACPICGPAVSIFEADSENFDHPINKAADLLAAGKIVAIKGLGGFHLAVRADDESAVARLRSRKKRDAKPLAVMGADLETVHRLVDLSDRGVAALLSPAAPIVLAKSRTPARGGTPGATPNAIPREIAPSIAPGTHRLGVMLPYTPLHHLLFAALRGRVTVLVMTSANVTDEPLVKDNDEARVRLTGICDAILWHNRPIERCVDDSIVIDMGDQPVLPIRRARGYAPGVIRLAGSAGLCVGGELKSTVAVMRDNEVILSQHLGDLKHTLAYEYFKKAIDDLCRLMQVKPQWIAHDLHPGYLSTQWAAKLAIRSGVPLIPVQHHWAHAAAVLAEHGVMGHALALVCDGVGYGTDGAIWGGELLHVTDFKSPMRRLAHLRPLLLPGGDAAARDTRRCAAGLLSGIDDDTLRQAYMTRLFPLPSERAMVDGMLASGLNCIQSTAAGRFFDAIAAILGLSLTNDFEAQAPMALEAAASAFGFENPALSNEVQAHLNPRQSTDGDVIDLYPLARWIAGEHLAGRRTDELAWMFHDGFARAWATNVIRMSNQTGLRIVGLSGGVFCNELLTKRLTRLLENQGLRVLRHHLVPPNDGGIAFGQAVIAAALHKESASCV